MHTDHSSAPIFSIRFNGEQFDHRNLPIYELAHVFIGVQRLFHKAYLANEERLEKGTIPHKAERRMLALQIGTHKKGSDYYGLLPFIAEPTVIATFKTLAEYVMSGLASFALEEVLDRLKGGDDSKKQIYINSIHADVVNIVDRIDGLSGCDSIQIGCPRFNAGPPIDLNAQTRAYVHRVADEFYLGSVQELKGTVSKLYPNRSIIEIRRHPGLKKCKLFLEEKDFNHVRFDQHKNQVITVTGRPRFQVKTERRSFDEFEVTKIDSIVAGEKN